MPFHAYSSINLLRVLRNLITKICTSKANTTEPVKLMLA